MNLKSVFCLSLFSLFAATACSHEPPKAEFAPPSPEAKIVAQQEKASYVTQLSFDKNSSTLTTSAKDKLDETLQRARRDGTIDDVKVIAWADQEYPSTSKKKLSKHQRDLATRRTKTLNDYIKAQTQANIDTYNMATRPNALEKLVSSSDARIKRSLEEAGIATTAHDLRFPENASKAMVMIVLKE